MDDDVVRTQLEKICSSPLFVSSVSLVRLLRAIVLETLDGRGDQLKEYVLGAEVLGKGPSFDPKIDPIVRMQIGRLRSKLHQYYQTEGRQDPVVIEIPKGHYVPVFRQATAPGKPGLALPGIRRSVTFPLILAIVVIFAAYLAQRTLRAIQDPVSIAVLPFSSLSSEPETQYFTEGLGEEIVRRLMRIEHLRIVRWMEKVEDYRELGRKLGVRAVLAGTVTKAGQRLRVAASLTDADGGHRIWAEVYDRELRDVFAVQDEISRAIASTLGLQLNRPESGRPAMLNLQAFELYLQGRYLLNWKDIPTTKRAIAKFQEALAEDPNYADAYAGLADCYARLIFLESFPPTELLPKMREAVTEALRLDENSADAHTSLAGYLGWMWDFPGAEAELRRAIRLNPNYALARLEHGVWFSAQGRHDEGLAETGRAMQLEPLSLAATFTLGVQLLWAGHYEQAREHLRKAVEIAPTIPTTHTRLGSVLLASGMRDQAIAEFQKALDLSGGHPNVRALLAHAYAVRSCV